MSTRGAAKLAADILKPVASLLSSPPTTPTCMKRKYTSPKVKKETEPVTGGWDVLPHGLGKKGDLGGNLDVKEEVASPHPPPKKRARVSKGATAVKPEKIREDVEIKDGGVEEAKPTKKPTSPSKTASEGMGDVELKDEDLEEAKPEKKRTTRSKKFSKVSDHIDVKVGDLEERKPEKKRTPRKKQALDTSDDVLEKVDDLIDESGKQSKIPRKKKHPYGLTPGVSPFPDHVKPTAEDCEEVTRLLSELHGEVKAPETVPPPSMEVTGCGEVPDLLDAILRTRLSATTTSKNSNLALKGLKDKFGLRTSGVGVGSVNWEAVHKATLVEVFEAIKAGGLGDRKSIDIKKILDVVHKENCARRDALLKEKKTGEPVEILESEHATREQKNAEISRANESLLSMNHVFEMTTDEAMEEMLKLPGIGVKTASCAILFCMKRPSFAVDTHVWRHCKWLDWVPLNATRDQTFSHCEVRIPDHLKYPLHQLFVRHGKTCGRCKAGTGPGTKEWEKTVCPIEHLVNRAKFKDGGRKKGKKGKKSDEESEEDDVE